MDPNRPNIINAGSTETPQGYGLPTETTEPLQVHTQNGPNVAQPAVQVQRLSNATGNLRRKATIVSIIITIVITMTTGFSLLAITRQANKSQTNNLATKQQDVSLKDASLSDLPPEIKGDAQSLFVNGDIITRGVLKVVNGNFSTTIKADSNTNQVFTLPNTSGTLCLDNNNCKFATAAQLATVQTTAAGGVRSLQGQTGAVTLTSGNGISIDGTTVSNGGVLSVGGQAGAISLGNGITINGSTVSNNGVVNLSSNSSEIQVVNNGNGSYALNFFGTGNGVILGPNASQDDNSNNPSIYINKLGTGNLMQFSTGSVPVDRFVVDSSGAITTGSIDFTKVSGKPTFVNSITGTANQVNASAAVGNITLSLPQNIAVTSSPTFAGLTLSAPLAVSSGGTGATTASGARGSLGAASIGANSDITSLSGLTTALSISQGGTGTTAVPTNGQLLIGNSSISGYSVATLTGGTGVTISNTAGAITINVPAVGQCSTCANNSLSNLTGVAINTTLLPGAATIDLGAGTSPFKDLYLGGSTTNNFKLTGTSTGGTHVLTLPDASGTLAVSASGNIALSAAGNISFTGTLPISSGGTGSTTTPTSGKLLIGNGSAFALNTLTAGAGVTIDSTGTPGQITISSPAAGSCTICADSSLSNIASVSIPNGSDLLPQNAAGINIGSGSRPIKYMFIAGDSGTPGSNNFKLTGTTSAGNVTLNLPGTVLNNSTLAAVQTAGSSVAQTGDLNVSGSFIAPKLQTSDGTGASGGLTVRTGNTTAGTGLSTGSLTIKTGDGSGTNTSSGNITLDTGVKTGSGTAGTLTLGGTNASDLILGRSGLVVKLPGGLTTQGGNIASGGGNLDLTAGTITSGAINSQTISSTANFTGTVTIQGASSLTLGTSSGSNIGAILFKDGANSNTLTLRSGATGSNFSLTLPTAIGGSGDCLKQTDGSGALGFVSCSSGLGGSGTDGKIVRFSGGSTTVGDSLLSETTNTITLQGSTKSFVSEGKIVVGLNGASGNRGQIDFLDGTNPGRTISVQAQQSGTGYTLQLPTDADVGSTCLILSNVSAGVNKLTGGSCAAGGSGGNITATGTTNGKLVRFTSNGPSYTAGASLIQDDGSGIGINTSPQSSYVFTVGSGNKFKVTDAGQLEIGTTGSSPLTLAINGDISNAGAITSSGLIQTSAGTTGLTLSGAPVAGTGATSLVRLGNTITGGNSSTNGGTYIGINTPGGGAGSAADFLNFQASGTMKMQVTNAGDITAGKLNGVTLATGGGQFTVGDGTRTLTVSASSTINQNLSTTSDVAFNSISSLATKLSVAQGGTGSDTSAASAGNTLLFNATMGKFVAAAPTSSDGSVTITPGDGSLNLQVSSCATCAKTDLSNLSGVAIQGSSLLTGTTNIDLGSTTKPFRDLYLYGTGTYGSNSLKFTGAPTGNRTLTVPDANGTLAVAASGNIALSAAGNITFTGTLPVGSGGTGVNTTPGTGKLLIGNGTGFSLNNLVQGTGVTIDDTTTPGSITISAAGSGTCAACANQALSNLSGTTSINSTLLAQTGIDLGSSTSPFRNMYIYGSSGTPGSNNFKLTGTTSLGNVTVRLPGTLSTDYTLGAVQTSGASVAQSGDMNVDGTLIAGTALQSPIHQTASTSTASTNSAAIQIKTGNATGATSSSGALTIDTGSATGTTGTLTIAGTNASALTLGRAALAVSLPGGLTTSGGNANLGSGTITSGAINGQTISSSANFTSTVNVVGTATIQGASSLTLGTASTNSGAIIFKSQAGAGDITVKASTSTNPTAYTLILPNTVGNANECIKNTGTAGTLTFGPCISGSGTNNKVVKFTPDGTTLGNSLIGDDGTTLSVTAAPAASTAALFQLGATYTGSSSNGTFVGINAASGFTGNLVDMQLNGAARFKVTSAGNTTINNGTLTVSTVLGTDTIKFGSGSDTIATDSTGRIRYSGNSRNTKRIMLPAEYSGAVLDADGTNNTGTLTSALDSANRRNYFKWTTDQATSQDYDIVVQVPIPQDWAAWSSTTPMTIQVFNSVTTANTIQCTITNSSASAQTTTDITHGSASTWADKTACPFGSATSGYTAGDFFTVRLHLTSPTTGDIRVGNIYLDYLSTF